jgi:hypothetical protein
MDGGDYNGRSYDVIMHEPRLLRYSQKRQELEWRLEEIKEQVIIVPQSVHFQMECNVNMLSETKPKRLMKTSF